MHWSFVMKSEYIRATVKDRAFSCEFTTAALCTAALTWSYFDSATQKNWSLQDADQNFPPRFSTAVPLESERRGRKHQLCVFFILPWGGFWISAVPPVRIMIVHPVTHCYRNSYPKNVTFGHWDPEYGTLTLHQRKCMNTPITRIIWKPLPY